MLFSRGAFLAWIADAYLFLGPIRRPDHSATQPAEPFAYGLRLHRGGARVDKISEALERDHDGGFDLFARDRRASGIAPLVQPRKFCRPHEQLVERLHRET